MYLVYFFLITLYHLPFPIVNIEKGIFKGMMLHNITISDGFIFISRKLFQIILRIKFFYMKILLIKIYPILIPSVVEIG